MSSFTEEQKNELRLACRMIDQAREKIEAVQQGSDHMKLALEMALHELDNVTVVVRKLC